MNNRNTPLWHLQTYFERFADLKRYIFTDNETCCNRKCLQVAEREFIKPCDWCLPDTRTEEVAGTRTSWAPRASAERSGTGGSSYVHVKNRKMSSGGCQKNVMHYKCCHVFARGRSSRKRRILNNGKWAHWAQKVIRTQIEGLLKCPTNLKKAVGMKD